MKKLLSLLMITSVVGLISCKKEAAVKPAAKVQKNNSLLIKKPVVYDYQKAIIEKRSAGRSGLTK